MDGVGKSNPPPTAPPIPPGKTDSIIDKVKTEALKSVTGGLGGALPLSNPSSVDSPSPSLPSPF